MAPRKPDTGLTNGQLLAVLNERLDGLEALFTQRFNAADQIRRITEDRLNKIEARFLFVIIGIAGAACLEIVRLFIR